MGGSRNLIQELGEGGREGGGRIMMKYLRAATKTRQKYGLQWVK